MAGEITKSSRNEEDVWQAMIQQIFGCILGGILLRKTVLRRYCNLSKKFKKKKKRKRIQRIICDFVLFHRLIVFLDLKNVDQVGS